jgi:hypothetical protein
MLVIRFFAKEDETYVGETEISEIPLEKLQAIFSVAPDNPMYDSYPITELKSQLLSKYVNFNFNFGLYDYFLELD